MDIFLFLQEINFSSVKPQKLPILTLQNVLKYDFDQFLLPMKNYIKSTLISRKIWFGRKILKFRHCKVLYDSMVQSSSDSYISFNSHLLHLWSFTIFPLQKITYCFQRGRNNFVWKDFIMVVISFSHCTNLSLFFCYSDFFREIRFHDVNSCHFDGVKCNQINFT